MGTRHAMSLIEVIIAISILVTVLVGVLSYQVTVDQLRQDSFSRVTRAILYANISNSFEGTPWDELATTGAGQREWSLPRLTTGTSNPPLTIADLRSQGLVSRYTGYLSGSRSDDTVGSRLEVFVEYFRATANTANGVALTTQPGLLDVQRTSVSEFRTELATHRADYLLLPTSTGFNDPNLLTPGDPILVRVVVNEITPKYPSRAIAENWFSVATSSD